METQHTTLYETPEVEVVNIKIGKSILSNPVPNSASRQVYEYYDLDNPNS